MSKYLVLFLLALNPAHADNITAGYGLGLQDDKLNVRVKTFNVALNQEISSIFMRRIELGMWSGTYNHQSASGYAQLAYGIRPQSGPLFMEAYWGIVGVTHPDRLLSGHLQFGHDLGVGFQGDNGTSLSLNYKHLSNAGLSLPNIGRDFIVIRIGFPLR